MKTIFDLTDENMMTLADIATDNDLGLMLSSEIIKKPKHIECIVISEDDFATYETRLEIWDSLDIAVKYNGQYTHVWNQVKLRDRLNEMLEEETE